MPEISRYFGIIIRMYREADTPHHRSHFHAYYGDEVAIYSVDAVELMDDWQRLQAGQSPLPVQPLQ